MGLRGALTGIRVLDISSALAAPTCAAVMADLGAEVIKIETPTKIRDRIRTALLIAIFPENEPGEEYWEENGFFLNTHRNKLGVTLDLKKAKAVDLLKRLVAMSDVLIENNRPGVMQRLGLAHNTLMAINPRLIILSNTGYGQTGRWSQYPGLASMMETLTGLAYASGYEDDTPERIGNGFFDYLSGWNGAIAVMAALHYRRRSNTGQHIDQSMFQVSMHAVVEPLLQHQLHGNETQRQGNRHRWMVPNEVYPCSGDDRWIAISVRTDAQWRSLCKLMGDPVWCRQQTLRDALGRFEHLDEVDSCLATWTRSHDAYSLMELLQEHHIPAGVVQTGKDVLLDPQLRARGAWHLVDHPAVPRVGKRPIQGAPFVLSETPAQMGRPSPTLGQHNSEVLGGLLGLTQDELATLEAEGVISRAPDAAYLDPRPDEILPLTDQKETGQIRDYDVNYRQIVAEAVNDNTNQAPSSRFR